MEEDAKGAVKFFELDKSESKEVIVDVVSLSYDKEVYKNANFLKISYKKLFSVQRQKDSNDFLRIFCIPMMDTKLKLFG